MAAGRFLDVDPALLRLPPSRHQGADPLKLTDYDESSREKLLRLLAQMSEQYPDWRLGQLVANTAGWARQLSEPQDTGIWDVEDEEMLAALESHLKHSQQKVTS